MKQPHEPVVTMEFVNPPEPVTVTIPDALPVYHGRGLLLARVFRDGELHHLRIKLGIGAYAFAFPEWVQFIATDTTIMETQNG